MVRPKRFRRIGYSPEVTYFKPRGVPMRILEEVDITLDELEAIRLKYLKGNKNEQSAKEMKISDSTFQRLTASALKKLADSLVNGKAIKIHNSINIT